MYSNRRIHVCSYLSELAHVYQYLRSFYLYFLILVNIYNLILLSRVFFRMRVY